MARHCNSKRVDSNMNIVSPHNQKGDSGMLAEREVHEDSQMPDYRH
jgi:hypothetical protein